MNAGLLCYIRLCIPYALLQVVNFCVLVLLVDEVILILLFNSQMFSEQDRSFDFAVSLDLLETDIHDSASNLDDSCLARFKFELILDLHQCSKLRHIVLQNEFPIFELNCSVRS